MPLATAALAATIVAVYGFELAADGQAVCEAYGLVPARPSIGTALTATSCTTPQSSRTSAEMWPSSPWLVRASSG